MHKFDSSQDYHQGIAHKQDSSSQQRLLGDTVHYYDTCHNDYLFAWCNRDNLALHYGYWDSKYPYQHHQALLNTNKALYQFANIQAPCRVLDAGCGLGGSSLWLAAQGNQVKGISISPKQVAFANKVAKKRKLTDSVQFEVANFCQTPYADGSFDVIWALESACYALDKSLFLKEAYRLLSKGGQLIMCDAFLLKSNFTNEQWHTVSSFLKGWVVPNLAKREDFQQMINEAGFEHTAIEDITPQILPSSTHMRDVAQRLKPIQKISRWLKLRSQTHTDNFNVGFAQYDFFHGGLAEYCIFRATK
jgi:cyclopropane fatty-acyl-phospholipid synthase-like methyltransferase|tara:strand:+ start:1273 stop:2184 length:912 start_codon:yes stop_codon:yes gene_type:complete